MTEQNPEKTLWKGKSSQILNLWFYLACIILELIVIFVFVVLSTYIESNILIYLLIIALIIPLFLSIWRYFKIYCRHYELTTERFRIKEGILTIRVDETELFRVKDVAISQPFWLRIFGLANVILFTSDVTEQTETVWAIKDAKELIKLVRQQTDELRRKKKVSEIDIKQLDEVSL